MNKFFNAHHAPVGSYSSFTLGHKSNHGGFGLMLGKPANQDIYIGYGKGSEYKLMPFFNNDEVVNIDNFTENPVFEKSDATVQVVADQELNREFNLGTDEFSFGNFSFNIYTPHLTIPQMQGADFKQSITPSIIASITLVNESDEEQEIIFGMKQNNKSSSLRHGQDSMPAIIDGLETSITTDDQDTKSVVHFTLIDALSSTLMNNDYNRKFMLGECGLLRTRVAPKSKKTVNYALSFYTDATITSGIKTKFKYVDYFTDIEDVAKYALLNQEKYKSTSLEQNEWLNNQELTDDERFHIAHAIKSYYGSSQLLIDNEERLYHLVNEGEYQMMQTFDLMIDHLFFELKQNPWVVKNNLELFMQSFKYDNRIMYEDQVYNAGISFTHDMGNVNQFSLNGRSSYELQDLSGCFSHMTYEQLTNFIITFMTYVIKENDSEFALEHSDIISQCLEGLLICDHPIDKLRNGIMSFDSLRVGTGSEITTYDSLDVSLGQARENTYLSSKTFASYCLLLEFYCKYERDDSKVEVLKSQLDKLQKTICNFASDGLIPAILDSVNEAYIIPIGEGLAYLKYLNLNHYIDFNGSYQEYMNVIKKHTVNVLQTGLCLFENGGYKLSSTSNMTWLSKIYLSQYVHKEIFNIDESIINRANAVHKEWLLHDELSYWAWSDQILNFEIKGSKYYPRGVTSILWTTIKS